MLNKISGMNSLLEVGCAEGGGLREYATVLAPGAKIRAIDHGQPHGDRQKPCMDELQETIDELKAAGFDAEVRFGNSHDARTLEWAKQQGPFDFVFIDAGHNYAEVKKDWEMYGPLGRKVGFHDISMGAQGLDVRQLWQEISRDHMTQEMTEPGGNGTGIVVMP